METFNGESLFFLLSLLLSFFLVVRKQAGAVLRSLACLTVMNWRFQREGNGACGFSLLLFMFLALRGFSPSTRVFTSRRKPPFNLIWNIRPLVKQFL